MLVLRHKERMSLRALLFAAALPAAVLVAVGVASPAHAGDAPNTELGLDLVPWSKKVGDRRYESPRDYDGTVKFFRDKFKGWKQIKWTREVSLPAVKYIHVENTTDSSRWQGVNIYALPDGRVRYYVLERVRPPQAAARKDAAPAKTAGAPAAPTAPAATPPVPAR